MLAECRTLAELYARYRQLSRGLEDLPDRLAELNAAYMRRYDEIEKRMLKESLGTDAPRQQTRGRPKVQHINDAGLELLKGRESLRLDAYRDQKGVWTIGWGHTGPEVKPGLYITRERADELLRQDVASAEQAIRDLVLTPLSSNRFSALVCLVYNIGRGAFSTSTIRKCLNNADWKGASAQFPVWNKITCIEERKDPNTGKVTKVKVIRVSNGLTNRRREERALFDRED